MSHRKGLETLDEELEVEALDIDGKIPAWLDGTLIRNGPAQFEVGDDPYRHWFDGHAMLRAFRFDEGRVGYANRFLETGTRKDALEEGEIVRGEFGTDPCKSLFGRAMQVFSPAETTDNANVNITRLADRFVAMTETPMPVVFDEETLETVGHLEYDDDLDPDMSTAHPLHDDERGETYNYVTEFGRQSNYRIYRQSDGECRRETVAELDVGTPRYMHSFAMTEDHVVLVEFPVEVNPLRLLAGVAPAEALEWKPELGTRFRVVDKRSGEVTGEGETDPFFCFHHVNAWEEGDELVVDMVAYEDASIIDHLYLDHLRSDDYRPLDGYVWRYRLGVDGSSLRGECLSDTRIELPRINEAKRARPHRFVWGTGRTSEVGYMDRLVRVDLDGGGTTTWHEEDCYPGEPVFVPRPNCSGEDDGVLLSVVLDGEAEQSFLSVFDAATLDEIGRATVPHHLPFGFHGNFYES